MERGANIAGPHRDADHASRSRDANAAHRAVLGDRDISIPRCAANNANRQCDKRPHGRQYAVDGNADDAEWKKNKPHDRIENDGGQSKRPAKNKEQAPEQKFYHIVSLPSGSPQGEDAPFSCTSCRSKSGRIEQCRSVSVLLRASPV